MAWNTYETKITNKFAIILIDEQYKAMYPIEQLSLLINLIIWCKEKPDHGSLWANSESNILDTIENDVFQLFNKFKPGWVIYILRINTYKIRELYFYTNNKSNLKEIISLIRNKHPTYKIELEYKVDADWIFYSKYLNKENI